MTDTPLTRATSSSGYFYTFLLVAGNKSVKAATRIRNIPSFVSLFSALGTGAIVRYTKHIKPLLMAGFLIEVLGLGESPHAQGVCSFTSGH
jgi:SIT family siderophore-iron:H+ symporter-like MFS transporter